MAIFSHLFSFFGGTATRDASGEQLRSPVTPVIQGMRPTTPDAALQLSAVWACVDLISKTIASMPMHVWEQKGEKKELNRSSRLWHVFHEAPNRLMSPFDFWRAMTLDLLLRGNAFAKIDRNSQGDLVALTPIAADQVEIDIDYSKSPAEVVYIYTRDTDRFLLKSDQVFHLKGMGRGLFGLSNLEFMRPTINEATSQTENASALFGQLNTPKGVLMVDRSLDDRQRKKLAEKYAGLQLYNESGLMILGADMKYQQVSLSPADAQLLESREFTAKEICQWFGVPEALVMGSDASDVSGAMDRFCKTTLAPIASNIEQTIRRCVMTDEERERFFVEFNLGALLRASISQRYEIYAKAVQNGLKTRNECRAMENDPPIEGADELTAQNNLVPLSKLGQTDASQTPQTPVTDEIRQ